MKLRRDVTSVGVLVVQAQGISTVYELTVFLYTEYFRIVGSPSEEGGY